jgi:hypothetical protein
MRNEPNQHSADCVNLCTVSRSAKGLDVQQEVLFGVQIPT